MAQTIKETVQVASLGKWGPKVGDVFYSWSKNIKDADKGRVVPGGTYDCEVYVADSGKKYINSVAANGNVVTPTLPVSLPKKALTAPKASANLSTSGLLMTRSDWDAKDRRISRQGCIQVAVQVTTDFDKAVELAEKMLKFVND